MTISTWLDGYLALRHRAFADRESIELPDGTRWPRTTGEQVAAIAATFTPAIRAHAVPRIVRQWRSTLADIQRDAFEDLHDTYVHNQRFWATLEDVALHLDGLSLHPPAMRAWNALLSIISTETGGDRGANDESSASADPPSGGPVVMIITETPK